MESMDRPVRDVAIPAAGLSTLRRALQKEAGALPAIHALHAAGYGSGEALWEGIRKAGGTELAGLDETAFWARFATVLARRGWGTLRHSAPHPGLGLLSSGDWAEATGREEEEQPSCAFSAGMLSGLLSGAASGPVAVLEVSCRTRGDERCTFAFGAAGTVHQLYGLLLEGHDLDAALAEL